jgi:hypothetical protein
MTGPRYDHSVEEFLSPEWILALDSLARNAPELDSVAESPVVIEQHVHTATGRVAYHLVLGPGAARVFSGPSSAPDLTLSTTESAARSIHEGAANAQACLAEGSMRLRGDPEVLTRHAAALGKVGDLFASMRS